MSDKKNIDRLFQERFKDFETPPPQEAWDAIEAKLDGKKNNRLAPVWWQIGSIAAALVVLFLLFNYFGDDAQLDTSTIDTPIVEQSDDSGDNKIESNNAEVQTTDLVNQEVAQENPGNTVSDEPDAAEVKDFYYTNATETGLGTNTGQKDSDLIVLDKANNTVVSDYAARSKGFENTDKTKANNTDATFTLSDHPNSEALRTAVAGADAKASDLIPTPETFRADGRAIDTVSTLTQSTMETALSTVEAAQNELPSLEDIARKEQTKDSVTEAAFQKAWVVSSQVGPVYANTMGGSSVNANVQDNNMSPALNLSYGLGVTYAISPKLSVRTGINQVNLSYGTEDINYNLDASFTLTGTTNISTSYNPNAVRSASTPTPSSDSFANGFAANEILNPSSFKGIDGTLTQRLGYLEVPVEIKYELLGTQQAFSLHVLGGVSALFLTENQVSVQNANEQLELGSDNNFNDFNQSANFGLGIGYQFTSYLGAFVEPTFKYQLNSLKNNTADFQPYTIGVQTGVSFKF